MLLDYFANLGQKMKPHQNPAEFILEVTGAGIPQAQSNGEKNGEAEYRSKGKEQEEEEEVEVEVDLESGDPKAEGDENMYVRAYKSSEFYQQTVNALEIGIYPKKEDGESQKEIGKVRRSWTKMKARLKEKYASRYYVQFEEIIKRSFIAYWRMPEEFLQVDLTYIEYMSI